MYNFFNNAVLSLIKNLFKNAKYVLMISTILKKKKKLSEKNIKNYINVKIIKKNQPHFYILYFEVNEIKKVNEVI